MPETSCEVIPHPSPSLPPAAVPKSVDEVLLHLRYETWRFITVDKEEQRINMYIKFFFGENWYAILLTDLVNIWFRSSDEKTFRKESKKFNPQLETKSCHLLQTLKKYFLREGDSRFQASIDSLGNLALSMSSRLLSSSYLFRWEFVCFRAHRDDESHQEALLLKEIFIEPLLVITKEMIRQRQKWMERSEDKDRRLSRQASLTLDNSQFGDKLLKSKEFKENVETPYFDFEGIVEQILVRTQKIRSGECLTPTFSRSNSLVNPSMLSQASKLDELHTSNSLQLTYDEDDEEEKKRKLSELEESEEELKRREMIEKKIEESKRPKSKKLKHFVQLE